jgi:hypothetical protein
MAWVNPGNITADDGSNATWAIVDAPGIVEGQALAATNFDFSAIPASSIIDGVELRLGDYSDTDELAVWSTNYIYLIHPDDSNGAGNPDTQPSNPTATAQTGIFGASDEMWGDHLTAADVKDVDFGATVATVIFSGTTTVSVDYMQMKVYYHAPVSGEIDASIVQGNNPPHVSSGGNTYVIALRGSALHALKSSDPKGGNTFVSQGTTGTDTAITHIASIQDGQVIHVAYISSSHYRYAAFNMATDSWSVASENITALTIEIENPWIDIAVRSDGDIIVAYAGDPDRVMGGEKQRVDYARRESASWTADQALDAAGDIHYGNPVMVIGTSDNAHILWQTTTNTTDPPNTWTDTEARTLDSANNLSTKVTSTSSVAEDLLGAQNAVSYDDAGTQRIVAFGSARQPVYCMRAVEDGSGDISSLAINNMPSGVEPYTDANEASAVFGVENGGDLHVLFSDALTQDLYYSTSTDDGLTWLEATEEIDALTINHIKGKVVDGTKIIYIYDDGGVTKYNDRRFPLSPWPAIARTPEIIYRR